MIEKSTAPDSPPVRVNQAVFRARKHFYNGTHRCVAPEETLERIRPHFARAGITRLADVTGLDHIGLTTIIAQRPNSPTLANAAGKGFTPVAATVSGAMEALEMFHAEQVRLPVVECTYNELRANHEVVPLDDLPFTRHPLFSQRRPEMWVRGWDLLGQCDVFVPFGSVSMLCHPAQRLRYDMPFVMGSNGLASGNHLLEAIAAALLEVIERDAIACQRAAQRNGRHTLAKVPLDVLTEPLVRNLLDRLSAGSIAPILYDCTVDTDVPVFMAYVYDRLNRHTGMYRGYGAHLDPEIAMIRALTEAVQSRLVYIAGSRDDFFRHDSFSNRIGDDNAAVDDLEHAGSREYRPPAVVATATFQGDIALLLERLRGVGVRQVIVVDLTDEVMGIPVVRVIVPGLEGYLFQFYAAGPRAVRARRQGIPAAPSHA